MTIANNSLYKSPMPVLNCPPQEAQEKNIETVYRLTLNNPPLDEDFLSHIEANKQYPPGKECVASSVSVYKDKEEAEKQKNKIPAYKRRGFIAAGPIEANTGVVLESKLSSHVDWWLYKGQKVSHLFKV
ncbi:hypothetical protein [Cohnella thermotolerans]|uniref:hypothetical protein n=1 Tax=Cohnella thermotolerans TaxID=329858 RepID=UPI0012EC52B0|nr:hypothetical protein [Cohnella thermotolerans]